MCPQDTRKDLQVVIELPQGESFLVRISDDVWRALKAIARKVGGDFGMEVKMGKPGEASRFVAADSTIFLDPVDVIDSPQQALFVAGHEGAHRAITPSPRELGLPGETVDALCRQVGFMALQNFIEDPAVNDWMVGRYPGMEKTVLDVYDDFAVSDTEGAFTPEVRELTQKIGYIPRFAKYGFQVIRRWHTGQTGIVLDPDVKLALERTMDSVDESIASIPDPESSEHPRILAAARKRFEINTNRVWPEYKKLVEKDIRTEAARQMLIATLAAAETLGRKREELEEAERRGNKQRQEQLAQEIEQLEKQLKPLDDLPREVREELERAMGKARQKLEEAGIASPDSRPLPLDELSEGAKRALRQAFENLPALQRRTLREKAKRQLGDYEDLLGQALEGRLLLERPQSHQKRREQADKEAARKRAEDQARQVSRGLEQARRARMTEYEKVYEEVVTEIDTLYTSLRRFLMPERHPRWRAGYPTGQRVDLGQVMQAVKDPVRLRTLWERKTIPHKIDYRFVFLVDVSGSMFSGAIEETFKGLVVLVEVLEKLWIPNEVIGFSDQVKVFKRWDERLDRGLRDKLAGMLHWGGGSTNTLGATRRAVNELRRNPGKDNFLVTMTDGMPDEPEGLKTLLESLEREKLIRTVGIGIGPETEGVEEYYKASLHLPVIKPSERQKREGARDFAEALSRLLEDMVRNPGKY